MRSVLFLVRTVALAVLSFALPGTQPVQAALVSHWALDDGFGVFASDDAGGNTGTLGGTKAPLWVLPGKIGDSALNFQGATSYVTAGNPADLQFDSTDPFTISAWVKGAGQDSVIAGKLVQGGNYRGYELHTNPNGTTRVYLIDTYGTNFIEGNYATPILDDANWHHVTMTYDGSKTLGGIKVYVDASLTTDALSGANNKNLLSGSIKNTTTSFDIGSRQDGAAHNFTGQIDDVAVWNEALTPAKSRSLVKVLDVLPGYNAKSMDQLFQVYGGALASVDIGELNWIKTAALPATPARSLGDVWTQGGIYYVKLSDTEGVAAAVPMLSVWTGNGLDGLWQTADNWSSPPADGYSLMFSGVNSTSTMNDFPAGKPLKDMVFDVDAGEFTLDGNAVNLQGNLVNSSINTQTIRLSLVLDGAANTINAASGDLVIQGAIQENGWPQTLVKAGLRTLTLTSTDNNYTGGTTVNAGTLQLGDGVTNNGAVPDDISLAAATTLTFANPLAQTYGGAITGNGVLVKTAAGDLELTGASATAGVRVRGGTLLIPSGSLTSTAFVSIGLDAGDTAALAMSGTGSFTVNATQLNIGDNAGSNGTMTISDNAVVGAGTLNVGKFGNAVGIVHQTGGTMQQAGAAGEWRIGGGGSATDAAAYGSYSISGGALITPANLQVGGYGLGVLDQTGGTVSSDGWLAIARWGGSYGVVDVSNGTLTASNAGGGLLVGEMGTGTLNVGDGGTVSIPGRFILGWNLGSGIVNLDTGGTIEAGRVEQGAGSGVFSFQGGTLKALAASETFMQGLTAAHIHPGGAILDTNGRNITIAQNLLAPTGQGVGGIEVTDGGLGYQGEPIVQISGGTGIGAAARAVLDPETGVITGFTITNPGSGYQESEVLTVTLLGGGATSPATVGAVSFSPNTSGGLTKTGLGTLKLTGANTYTGATSVDGGVLHFASPDAVGGTAGTRDIAVGNEAGVAFGFPIDNTWLNRIVENEESSMVATSGDTTADLDFASPAGATLPNASLGAAGNATFSGTLTQAGTVVRLGGGGGTLTFQPAITGEKSLLVGGAGGGAVVLVNTGNNYTGGTTVLPGCTLQGDTTTLPGDILNDGAVVFDQTTDGALTGTISGNGSFAKTGPATLTITGEAHAFSGGTTVNGGTLQLGDGATNGSVPGNFIVAAGASLKFANPAEQILGGAISGAGSLVKAGDGTLTIATVNTYTGGTAVNAGTLRFTAGALGAAGNVSFGGGTLQYDLGNAEDLSGRIKNSTSAVAIDTNGNDVTFASPIDSSNSGGLAKSGEGTLTLDKAQSYAGNTVVTGGTLKLNNAINPLIHYAFNSTEWGAVPNLGTGGAALDGTIHAASSIVADPQGARGDVLEVGTGGVASPTVNLPNTPVTLAAWVSSTGAVAGAYMRIITNNYQNSVYLGTDGSNPNKYLTIVKNAFDVTNQTVDPSGAWHQVVQVWDGANDNFYYDGELVLSTPRAGLTTNFSGPFGFGNNPSLAGTEYWRGYMSDSHVFTTALSSEQVRQLYASGVPTFGNVLPTTTAVQLASGATLDLNGVSQQIASLADVSGSAGGAVTSTAPATLTLDSEGDTAVFSGSIHGAVSLVKSGAGTQILAGASDYTGATTVSGGVLEIANAAALPAGGSLTIGEAGTVVLAGGLSAAAGQAVPAAGAPAAVPEPGTFVLLAAGILAAAALWRRRRASRPLP